MNTHDIELPPLPRPQVPRIDADSDLMDIRRLASWCEDTAKGYAREAIEADRKRRGEPVPKGWKLVPETPTSKQIVYMACQIKGADADGWFRTDGDDWPEHVDAAERAYKWALSEAPQPAELGKEMTKPTMPEPVAYQYENPYSKKLTLNWRKSPAPGSFTPLVTEGQAEAYAEARVREALEEAAMILKANAEACHSDTRIMLRANAEAIRALIPSTPA